MLGFLKFLSFNKKKKKIVLWVIVKVEVFFNLQIHRGFSHENYSCMLRFITILTGCRTILFYEIAAVEIFSVRMLTCATVYTTKHRTRCFQLSNNEAQWQKWTEIRETSTRGGRISCSDLAEK